jgi:hypothetical protein
MGSSLVTVEEAADGRDVTDIHFLKGVGVVIIVPSEAWSSGAEATYSKDGATERKRRFGRG